MNPILNRTALAAALLATSSIAAAQSPSNAQERWGIGAGVIVIDSPYAGEGTRTRPVPLIHYEGERFFLGGTGGGMHLYRDGGFSLSAIASARLMGFDIDDLGAAELVANGLDPSLLSDRDDGLDAGLRASYGGDWGSVTLQAVHDVTDASDGHEISFDYRYRWMFDRTEVTAHAGASRMSAELAGYYYGTLDEERQRGVAGYSPDAAVIGRLGVTLRHAIGRSKWQLVASVEHQRLPGELTDSPLLEADRDWTHRVMIGLTRRF